MERKQYRYKYEKKYCSQIKHQNHLCLFGCGVFVEELYSTWNSKH